MICLSPSYWSKSWVWLALLLFNDRTQGIYAKSIDNQNIKDWSSNKTNLELIENQTIQFQNNENMPLIKKLETDDFYEKFLKTQGWSNDPEIAQQQLQKIQKEHNHFLQKKHKNKRHKRNNKLNHPDTDKMSTDFKLTTKELTTQNDVIEEKTVNNFTDSSFYSNLIKDENIKKIYLFYTNDETKKKIEKSDQIILTDKNLYYLKIQNLSLKKINCLNQNIKNLFFNQFDGFNFYVQTSQNEFYWANLQTLKLHKIIIKDKLINENVFINILEIIKKDQKIYEFSQFLIEEIYDNKIFNTYLIKNSDKKIYQINLSEQSIIQLDCSTTKEIDKEINFFYQKNKSDVEIENENTKIFDFNLGNINPLDYQKIEFLGNKFETSSFWGLLYHIDTGKNISYFNGYNLSNLIINEMLTNSFEIENKSNQILLPLQTTTIGWASVTVKQSFGLSFYWNHNYYLQVFIHQNSSKSYWAWDDANNIMNIGKGIKLYNDDDFNNKKNTRYVEFGEEENIEQIIISRDWDDYDNEYLYNQNNIIIEQNFGNINPLDYQKIEFLGSIDNFHQSRVSWGNEKYYVENFLDDFNNKNIVDIITNYKFDKSNNYWEPTTCKIMLQNEKVEETWHSKLTWKMCLGLSFYWENNNYYLQVLIRQYAHSNTMSIWSQGGALFTGIGKAIKLYNDNALETQIKNLNDRKKREIFEEENKDKWTDNFTKLINHAQHLPINNTNFVTNKTTSLY